MKYFINSECDGLPLSVLEIRPLKSVRAVVQISHGMCEHKERYVEFMNYMASYGYACVIHDHRGHGKSVRNENDLGYFYTEDINYIVNDLYTVTKHIKQTYKGVPVFMFAHSMGTLVARNYLKKHDDEIEKIILCGPPTHNELSGFAFYLAKLLRRIYGGKKHCDFLTNLVTDNFNRGYKTKNEWISSDKQTVAKYNSDPLCNFEFTINGYINLIGLLASAYKMKEYALKNPSLKIHIMAGENDPVIESVEKLENLKTFLDAVGYNQISLCIYKKRRHELLNEKNKKDVFKDILKYLKD